MTFCFFLPLLLGDLGDSSAAPAAGSCLPVFEPTTELRCLSATLLLY